MTEDKIFEDGINMDALNHELVKDMKNKCSECEEKQVGCRYTCDKPRTWDDIVFLGFVETGDVNNKGTMGDVVWDSDAQALFKEWLDEDEQELNDKEKIFYWDEKCVLKELRKYIEKWKQRLVVE